MDLGIAGKRALVCASSKGLGKGCALALAAEGVDMVLVARGAEALQRTADEIALSILAEIVKAIRLDGLQPSVLTAQPEPVTFGRAPAAPVEQLTTAIDPICGMTVVVAADTPTATVNGEQFWFCCTGCRDRHLAA